MSNFEKYLNSEEPKNVYEGKGLFAIISTFFSEMRNFSKFAAKAHKASLEYEERIKSNVDSNGNIDIAIVNQEITRYLDIVEGYIKTANVSKSTADAFMKNQYKMADEFKKKFV